MNKILNKNKKLREIVAMFVIIIKTLPEYAKMIKSVYKDYIKKEDEFINKMNSIINGVNEVEDIRG